MKNTIAIIITLALCTSATSAMAAPVESHGSAAARSAPMVQRAQPAQVARPMQQGMQARNAPGVRPGGYQPHGYPGASGYRGPVQAYHDNGYGRNYNGGWQRGAWRYDRPYARIYYGNHWGFWLTLAGIDTFIIEDTVGNCYYLDEYGDQRPWCDPAYADDTNMCVCP